MRRCIVLLACLVLARPSYGQTVSRDSAAVIALEHEMAGLLAAARIDEYATHLAPDYARTSWQGVLQRRDEALASWRAQKAGGAVRPADLWVRVHGDVAILTGVVSGADSTAPRNRFTKTFVRQDGRWLLVALHGSRIAQR